MVDGGEEGIELPSTLSGLQESFEKALPEGTLAYYSGGAADELTLRRNELAWQERELRPTVMVDVSERDTSTELLGRRIPLPFAVAPTAYHRLAHPGGEEAMARGAAAAGCPYTLSTLATSRPEAVAKAVPDGVKWFQVYVFRDRSVTRELVEEAARSGFEALLLTVDLPVLGRRDREIATGFVVGDAEGVPGVHAAGASGTISMQDTADLIDPSLTWDDVEELASWSSLPVLVKGVLRPDDARRAIESGAAGVVVSNHGGRQLDGVLATADALGPVVAEVGGQSTVMVDGGIRRGVDIARALIMGADAVLVGRPCLWGLAAGGAAGVERVLAILADEFDRSLALLGVPAAGDLRGRSDLLF
jgi:isopentenyl diphosphate isomerase/L-lactate dehydrogenase-like FMN-dependent dehydrogenase